VTDREFALDCPVPRSGYDRILMAHGGGGKLSADLVRNLFLPAYGNQVLARLEDQATLPWEGGRLAFTTDSFVVRPIFFPGGDIGKLAVNGTVNDLAMGGARPLYLSAAFILEEGLRRRSRAHRGSWAPRRAAKVAWSRATPRSWTRARGPGVITTSGVGASPRRVALDPLRATGDRIVLRNDRRPRHGDPSQREGIDWSRRSRATPRRSPSWRSSRSGRARRSG
jgi:hydrogenase expression/formation protein HypE